MARLISLILASGCVFALGCAPAMASSDPIVPVRIRSVSGGSNAEILGASHLERDRRRPSAQPASGAKRGQATAIQPMCDVQALVCTTPRAFCPDPARPVAVWVVRRVALAPPSPDAWTNLGEFRCVARAEARPAVVVTQAEFQRLPIPAPKIVVEPAPQQGHSLVNIETNFLTSDEPVVLGAVVLGQSVQVRAPGLVVVTASPSP